MLAMEPNHERLLKLVREARRERGLSKQNAFIDATGLGRTTIQRFERGERLGDGSYRAIDWALGWAAGSCIAVLGGGEPTLAKAEAEPALADFPPLPPSLQPLRERLPKRVLMELDNGEVLDTEIYDLTVGGGVKMITVVIADPVTGPRDFAELRQTMRAYERIKRFQHGQTPLPWEPGDPEEWKTTSEG